MHTDELHQYGGFAEKEPETMSVDKVKEILSMKGDLKKHAEKAIYEFCPRLSDMDRSSPSDMLYRIEMLKTCMKTVYFCDAKCWHDGYEEFENFVSIQTCIIYSSKSMSPTLKGVSFHLHRVTSLCIYGAG